MRSERNLRWQCCSARCIESATFLSLTVTFTLMLQQVTNIAQEERTRPFTWGVHPIHPMFSNLSTAATISLNFQKFPSSCNLCGCPVHGQSLTHSSALLRDDFVLGCSKAAAGQRAGWGLIECWLLLVRHMIHSAPVSMQRCSDRQGLEHFIVLHSPCIASCEQDSAADHTLCCSA